MIWLLVAYFCQPSFLTLAGWFFIHGCVCHVPVFVIICPFPAVGDRLFWFYPGPVSPLPPVGVSDFVDFSTPSQLVRFLTQFCVLLGLQWLIRGGSPCPLFVCYACNWLMSVDKQGSYCFVVYCCVVFSPIIGIICFAWSRVKRNCCCCSLCVGFFLVFQYADKCPMIK